MKNILKPMCGILPFLILILSIFSGCQSKTSETTDFNMLYESAIRDTAFADPDEILPLVSLTESDPMTTWQDGKVLLLTWHNYPDSYPEGETVSIAWGPVWTFTEQELLSYGKELHNADAPEMRFKQIIGFAPDSQHSTVTGFWVDPKNVKRPAYQSNPTIGDMTTDFGENTDEEYKNWFDENILWSYYYGAYPWTRLGYTYDWADNGTEYGMTEFIVENHAEVTVAFTETTDEFLHRIMN
ncbi:MAG: hypothetical protein K2O42_04995 [Oscillospiraceae bacterium]|nr:hypothetical protein [Oscillospiraceae bacterium]